MKNNKYQKVRFRVSEMGQIVRFESVCDKDYKTLKGVHISIPDENAIVGAMCGMRLNNVELFDDAHEVKMITANNSVSPNQKFFIFPENIEANNGHFEGKYTDGSKYPLLVDNGRDTTVYNPMNPPLDYTADATYLQNPKYVKFPYDVVVTLWLTN